MRTPVHRRANTISTAVPGGGGTTQAAPTAGAEEGSSMPVFSSPQESFETLQNLTGRSADSTSTSGDVPLIDSGNGTAASNTLTYDTYVKLAGFLKNSPEQYEQTAPVAWHTKLLRTIRRSLTEEHPGTLRRWIVPNDSSFDASIFPHNKIDNRRYSFYTFLIFSLLDQFRFSVYNIYFLLLAISQFIPVLRVGPIFTYFAPLAFVVVLSMVKDAFDDFKRWLQDRSINNTEYQRLKPDGTFETILSSQIQVGDILRVEAKKRVPSDMVLLHTSESTGTCFVRTDQLDGETDWKLRYPVKATLHMDVPEIAATQIFVECEAPHRDIYSFHGTLLKQGCPKEGIDVNNTIWSACTVAAGNILGLVIHTGVETRATMNAEKSAVKQTLMEREMNFIGYLCFVLLFILALLLTIVQLGIAALPFGQVVVSIFRFQILLSMIIPISLNVNLTLAKLWYSIMIFRDQDALPGIAVRNTNIAEELGRLHYLFSDKTGTLTKNKMEFRNLHLEDNFSLEDSDAEDIKAALGVYFDTVATQMEKVRAAKEDGMMNLSDDTLGMSPMSPITPLIRQRGGGNNNNGNASALTPPPIPLALTAVDSNSNEVTPKRKIILDDDDDTDVNFARQQQQAKQTQQQQQHSLVGYNRKQSQLIGRAVLALALCHQVTPVRDTETGTCEFQAASPDEISMVEFAAKVGLHLESRLTLRRPDAETGDILEGEMILKSDYGAGIVSNNNNQQQQQQKQLEQQQEQQPQQQLSLEYDVLKAFPFSSERKCMSIILRNKVTGQITFFMKGADVKMAECIPKTDATSWLEDRCGDLARMGRRTLVFGMKDMTLDQYKRFARDLNEASAAQTNRAVAVEGVMRDLERNLDLVALTGVEDQLQDNVVSTLEHLGACGIKVWMLTGDKIETARCIGRSTKLIRSDLIETLVAPNKQAAAEQLDELSLAYAPIRGGGGLFGGSSGGGATATRFSMASSSGAAAAAASSATLNGDGDLTSSFAAASRNNNNNNNSGGGGDDDFHVNTVAWSLVIDGKTLEYFLGSKTEEPDPVVERTFLRVASRADSVVVARCSPTQKALVVQAIIKYRGPSVRAAAIGDGGNDVSMIRAAHVGIGIEGVEGKQASLAADYSITSFKHCERLITWHGRNSYLRTASLTQFIIHRGTVYAIIQAVFSAIFSGSTMALFNGYLVSLYSAFYTMAPVFAIVLNEDRLEEEIVEFPELYRWLLKGRAFNARSFLQWMWLAFFQGGIIMYMTVKLLADEMFQLVSIAFSALMFTELFYVATCMDFKVLWTQRRIAFVLFFLSEGFSLFCYFISVVILPATFDRNYFFSASFWGVTTLISAASILPVALIKFIEVRAQRWLLTRRTHRPSLFKF